MRMVDLILKKRYGMAHTREEIDFIINGYCSGELPDYQISAWLMAICFSGMDDVETGELTGAMIASGDTIDLSDIPGAKLDKHSTGGVGDTTTLIAAPLVAACGGTVAKLSGRGLGHTGGTLDKLESVPGVSVSLSIAEFKSIVKRTGICVMGQTGDLVPADKLLYALRDVTGTVKSLPLIASSIMSKKLAAGTDVIVLDVKTGTGAFMETPDDARSLAQAMVRIGERLDKRVCAIITDMNQPLGLSVGNGLEVREAIEALSGRVAINDPLMRVSLALGAAMLSRSGIAPDMTSAEAMLLERLRSGEGLEKLKELLEALGGDTACVLDPDVLCRTKRTLPVTLGKAGYVGDMRADMIGVAAQLLGAGRAAKDDVIDHATGLVMKKRRGDRIEADEPFALLYVNDEKNLTAAVDAITNAVEVCSTPPKPVPIMYDII